MTRKRRSKDRKFVDKNVYELAVERVNHIFDMFDHVAVLFSGGKDSTAVLNVAYEVAKERGRLPLTVIHYDEEAIPYQTEEYVRRTAQLDGIDLKWMCVPLKMRNACSRKQPYWYCWHPDEKDLWVRPMPPEAINAPNPHEYSHEEFTPTLFDPKDGNVCVLLGIRAQESLNRLRMVTAKVADNYITQYDVHTNRGNVSKAYPIYDWTTEDVWTAPNLFGWDYNHAYDVLDKAGMSPSLQRCSPPFGEEPLQKLWSYKTCFPEIWDKMSVRVHGANTAIRYALTELYGYGSRPTKPEGMSWEQYIVSFIKRHDPKAQKLIAKRIQDEIKAHYRKTDDPILPKAKHPETGVCWDFLVMIAMRGDFKGRKQAGSGMDQRKLPELWEKYNNELEQYQAGEEVVQSKKQSYIVREMG